MNLGAIARHRLFWPLVALVLLLVASALKSPAFLEVTVRDGHLFGGPVDILRRSSVLLLVALGMTLVIATRGIDLSVGAVMAIAGAVALSQIAASPDPGALSTVLLAMATALAVALAVGVFNGFLVAVVGIQPIVATLIFMTAGRGIAMLITGGQITTVTSAPYKTIASGYWLGLPVAALIAAFVFGVTALLTRRTALGVLIESVGINPSASRLAGVRARTIIWTVYVICAAFACIAGFIKSSDIMAADSNNAGLFIELDAILAVVIGGTSLAGGKFSLTGTLVGSLVITTLTLSITILGIPVNAVSLFKALVVIAVCLLQSPVVQHRMRSRRRRVAPVPVEVPA
ncbi:sugar ABC transporter permease [Cellulomonas chitinilytica]|uniref:Sugar ABC transporter permease n=1 Tax=Cellulomonas chitinilytica TaxID=398759 RepID=A0A919P2M2_9CELL|nr:ABC transporter permease [Cellulomonas chitinilytica]GIG22182.1 sugar ABC transporter permease [Cellulomonas chitinilytica]